MHIREAPKKPTKREVEEHEVLHERYEAWCRHCVRGRGRNRPHRRVERNKENEDERVPRISMDYNSVSENDEKVGTWLTMVDSKSKAVWSRVVQGKGVCEETEWVIRAIVEELDDWGFRGEDLF